MIGVRGSNSLIARAVVAILPRNEEVWEIPRGMWPAAPHVTRYLICQGLLFPLRSSEQTEDQKKESMRVNCTDIIDGCNYIFSHNPDARICVIGSESAYSGSYDDTYAKAKRSLHEYVERKKLLPKQQLVCVAPSIVGDAGMTIRREDHLNLERRRRAHPKQRFASSMEVAKLIKFLLYVDEGYLSGITIRMNGGAHTA